MGEIEKEIKGVKEYTIDEWRAKGKSLFGEDVKKWSFKCPACGNVASVQDFINVGLSKESACNAAYQECIGRYTGAGAPTGQQPCNWSAYGLFGTLGNGAVVNHDGKQIEVFRFDKQDDD